MIQEKIEIIRDKFKNASIETLPELMTTYREDGRIGVGKILERAQKKLDAYNKELDRVQKMLSYERQYGECGVICGIDEAGRGPLAGPVVAAAVILDINCPILYVNDSKKLSEKKREELYDEIMEKAVSVGVGIASPETIDEINILQGDAKSLSIAAASIIAKVTRDRMMREYDKLFPEYDFAKNKGYGTAEHVAALKTFGPTPIHRRSFISNFI